MGTKRTPSNVKIAGPRYPVATLVLYRCGACGWNRTAVGAMRKGRKADRRPFHCVPASVHIWGHNIGLPVMMLSLGMFLYGPRYAEEVVATGLVVVLASIVAFIINLLPNGSTEPGK